jgi:hypothetical protein
MGSTAQLIPVSGRGLSPEPNRRRMPAAHSRSGQPAVADANKLSVTLSVRLTADEREGLERLVGLRLSEIHKLDATATFTASALVRGLVLDALVKLPPQGERRSGRERRQKAATGADMLFDLRSGRDRRRRKRASR